MRANRAGKFEFSNDAEVGKGMQSGICGDPGDNAHAIKHQDTGMRFAMGKGGERRALGQTQAFGATSVRGGPLTGSDAADDRLLV